MCTIMCGRTVKHSGHHALSSCPSETTKTQYHLRPDTNQLTQLPAAYGVVPQNGDGRVLEVTAAAHHIRQEGQSKAAHSHEPLQRLSRPAFVY